MLKHIALSVFVLPLSMTCACRREVTPIQRTVASPSPSANRALPTVDSGLLIPAAAAGDIVKVRELLAAGADVNVRAVGGSTPLIEAAYAGHTEVARVLLDSGARVGLRKDDGETALSFAQSGNHAEIVQMLSGVEDLLVAAGKGELTRVQELLDNDVRVNARGVDGRTALMEAAYGGHTEVVKLLLASGANVTPRKDDGANALSLAEGGKYPGIVALLKSAGAE
jgi:ankyrin repeat protein